MRRTVLREIQLLKEHHHVVGIPCHEHFVESRSVDVLPHAQKVGAFEAPVQTIRLKIETAAETRESVLTIRQNEEKVATCFELFMNGPLPVRALDSNGL